MKVLFISRKRKNDVGGLARFTTELTSRFKKSYLLAPDSIGILWKLPFLDFNIIHLGDVTLLPLGMMLKKIFGKPLAITAHGLDLTMPNLLYQGMLKVLLPKVDAVIIDAEKTKLIVDKFLIDYHKVHVVNLGISIDHFKYTEAIDLPVKNDRIFLLTVGNLVRRKGHTWFIKNVLLNLGKKYIYLIVGDGRERKNIKETAKKFSLEKRVFLLSRLNDKQLAYVFKNTDIYVCPNIHIDVDFEGFGIAAGEAAAMGLPVVAGNVDGISDMIINEENGLLVESSIEGFIKALNRLKDQKFRKLLGEKAQKYTKRNFSWVNTTKGYQMIFRKLIYSG